VVAQSLLYHLTLKEKNAFHHEPLTSLGIINAIHQLKAVLKVRMSLIDIILAAQKHNNTHR
jgi:hypothetical protein